MEDVKGKVIAFVLSGILGLAGGALSTWRTAGQLEVEVVNLKREIEVLQRQDGLHQEDIKRMYSIDGKLGQLITEVQNLREDLRAQRK